MTSLTRYSQKKLIDLTLGLASYTLPTASAALFTASPGEDGLLTNEVSGGSYARVELTSKIAATTLGTGLATSTSVVTFPAPSGTWGTITYLGIMDNLSPANVLLYMPLLFPIMVGSGSPTPSFAIGKIEIAADFDGLTSSLTKYLAKKWLDHLLGKSAYTPPTTCYLALFSDDPTEEGLLVNELATGAYARQSLLGLMGLTTLATSISESGYIITFPTPTADYNVTHFGLLDDLSPANVLMRKPRGNTLRVTSGSAALRVDPGALQISAD